MPSTGNLRPPQHEKIRAEKIRAEKMRASEASNPENIGPDRDQTHKELPESIRRALPMLESLSRIDRYLIVETCNMIIANIQETLAADWFRSPQRKYHPRRYSIT